MSLDTLRFRAPPAGAPLRDVLARACPGASPARIDAWVSEGVVSVHGRVARRVGVVPEPGLLVEVAGVELGAHDWPALRAHTGRARVLTAATPYRRGSLPGPDGGAGITFERVAEHDGVTELEIRYEPDPLEKGRTGAAGSLPANDRVPFERAVAILERLAHAGLGVLGDPFNGAVAWMEHGPAWREAPDPRAAADGAGAHPVWPTSPPLVGDAPDGTRAPWRVSEATARVIERGHPWIRLDDETADPRLFRPGLRVDVVSGAGRRVGQALVEGAGRDGVTALAGGDVAGRMLRGPEHSPWSVEACVARAVERRSELLAGLTETDAFRLVHGEAEGLPGLHVDRLGPLVRVLVTARCAVPLVDRVLIALGGAGSGVVPDPWRIVEVVHLDERPAGRFECARVHPFSADPDGAGTLGRRAEVREAGLVHTVEPGLAEPDRSAPGFGLFLDQRANRRRFAARAQAGGRFLNLFAHTGAFSVAALAAGADSVVSVDLSAAYLRWLDSNVAANAAAAASPHRHESVRQDGRRYLERLDPGVRFDGIVLDPPTAAAAGRRFFSVRRDLVPMIAACLAHLDRKGALLVTLNDRRARKSLEGAVRAAAAEAGVRLARIESAPPASDFPRLDGFEEGEPFRGCFVHVD